MLKLTKRFEVGGFFIPSILPIGPVR